MSARQERSGAIVFLVSIGLAVAAALGLLGTIRHQAGTESLVRALDVADRQLIPPRQDLTLRRLPLSIGTAEGQLRVIVTGAGGPVTGARLLVPGTEGLVGSSGTGLLGATDEGGACQIQLRDVRDTGFGVVASNHQSRFVTPEFLESMNCVVDSELVVTLVADTTLSVRCIDPLGFPVGGCRITVCRSGALSWAEAEEADGALWSLDSLNGQHVAWADEVGKATISGLARAAYYLRVEKRGFCATTAGSTRAHVVPPDTITVTMAPIEVVRAVVDGGGERYLSKLTRTGGAGSRVASLGVLDAAQRQVPALLEEECWATMDLGAGPSIATETLTVIFANGSKRVVDLPYQRLGGSTPVLVEPGEAQPTVEVQVRATSSVRQSLAIRARVAKLGGSGSGSLRSEFEAAMNLALPCKLQLPPGAYLLTVIGVDRRWFEPQMFEVADSAVTVRLATEEPLVPVSFRRETPRGYLAGLWNVRFGTPGYPTLRRQCTPAERKFSVLAPVGNLRYSVRAPGLRDLEGAVTILVDEPTDIVLRQIWE